MLYRDAFGFVVKDEDNFNIVCGEFVISINNNDNVSITHYKPSTNAPQAYNVASVDELPSNAVDGSMAVVESDSIEGSWQFDYENPLDFSDLNITGYEGRDYGVQIRGYNDTYGGSFSFLTVVCNGGVIQLRMEQSLMYDSENGWDDNYSPFEFFTDVLNIPTSGNYPIPFTVDDFKQFIKSNAERLSGGYSLYTHENGQWVYKSEIV